MRGAAPDVECPRCNAQFPPTFEALVTCAQCGLVFTPHEVVHRAPLVETITPPSSLVVRSEGDTTVVTSHLSRLSGIATLLVIGFLVLIVAGHWRALSTMQQVFMFGFAPLAAYVGTAQLIGRRIVSIGPTSCTVHITPLPLPGSSAIEIWRTDTTHVSVDEDQAKRYVVTARAAGVEHPLVVSRSRDVAEYMRDLIATAWNLP